MSAFFENENYEKDVLAAVDANHIWLNAFACVRPTDEFCAAIGRDILRMLDEERNLIKPKVSLLKSERDLVVRINRS